MPRASSSRRSPRSSEAVHTLLTPRCQEPSRTMRLIPRESPMNRFQFHLAPRGPFSMDPIRQLECGFLRGSRTCSSEPNAVSLAFPTDGDFSIAGARLKWDGEVVHVDATTAGDEPPLRAQLERILGLDHDATGFWSVIERAPELRAVASSRPGFRPVVAYSPYVMGVVDPLPAAADGAGGRAPGAHRRSGGRHGERRWPGDPGVSRPESILARSSFPGVRTRSGEGSRSSPRPRSRESSTWLASQPLPMHRLALSSWSFAARVLDGRRHPASRVRTGGFFR